MGIFSFFKKLGRKKEIEEIVLEKLDFDDIGNWIEKKNKENEIKEKEILSVIEVKTKCFIKDLKEKIVILKDFDIKSIKEKDRIKNIVANSREKYMESVENFIERLNNLKEPKLRKFIEKINKVLFEFNKASFKNSEKVTILIGKEIVSIREGFKTFSKDLLEIFNNNKEISELFNSVEFIKSKLNLLSLANGDETKIKEVILSITEKINQKERENLKLLNKIGEIKRSDNYKNMLAEKEKISAFKEEYKNSIFTLKQLIDFKALTSFFHIIPEKMKIVKDYREDFHMNFGKDNGKDIIELLEGAKLSNASILEKANQIGNKIKEIADYEKNVKKDETKEVFNKKTNVGVEIDNLKEEKIKEEKRDEKLKINKEELVNVLKQELANLNVEIV